MSGLGDNEKRIKVAVRARPLHPVMERYDSKCVRKTSETDLVITSTKNDRPDISSFSFDYSFDEDDQQIEIYNEAVLDLVDSTLDGHNATVLAYGQTGSGKTFTMLGEVDESGDSLLKPNSGLFLRVLTDLFLYKERCAGHMHVIITLSIVEIYIQEVRDLLNKKKPLKVQVMGENVSMPDLRVVGVSTLKDVFQYFKIADKERVAKSTAMNPQSSRSHALFMIDLFQQAKTAATPEPPSLSLCSAMLHSSDYPKQEVPITKSRICLVDLAGSERIGRSQVEGQMKNEAIAINKSLTVLGTVVQSLYKGSKHVPFRDSTLTLSLKSVFTDPNCKVLLCANLSPAQMSASESKSTLTFANKVKDIKATSVTVDPQAEIEYLERLKKLEELCGDLRIAAVLHSFILQRPSSIRHVKLSDDAGRAALLKEVVEIYNVTLKKKKAIQEQQEEEEIHRLAKEIAQKQIDEMKAKQAELQQQIEKVNEEVKVLAVEVVKVEEEKKVEIEQKTNQAKKIRRTRRNNEDKIAKLQDENQVLEVQLEEITRAVMASQGNVTADSANDEKALKQIEEEAKRSEEAHRSAQVLCEKAIHLRNHQLDYFRHKIEVQKQIQENATQGIQTGSMATWPFIREMVEWVADRATRISNNQADYHDGETCEHITRLLPFDKWPHPFELVHHNVPIEGGEETIDAPYDSDYESDAPLEDTEAAYKGAAASIGETIATLENAEKTSTPIQYDFMVNKKKTDEDDKKKQEEMAKQNVRETMTRQTRAMKDSQVTRPYDEEEADKHYLMMVYDTESLISDLLRFLRFGTKLLKHGRRGDPHKRKFWIESKQSELIWSDEDCETHSHGNKQRRAVSLRNVTGIVMGMYSKVFKRNKVSPSTEGFYQAFTIVIKNGKRTIDVIAETLPEFEAWLLGLSNKLNIEPVWGEPLPLNDPRESEVARQLSSVELDTLQKHHIKPTLFVELRKKMSDKRDEIVSNRKLFNGDMRKVHQALGGLHAPQLNNQNAMLMTKGELRFYSNIDIFRTCIIWKLLEGEGIIYDPKFRLPTEPKLRN